MAFKEHLQQVCGSVEGAILCTVMGFDGISVETHQAQDPELDMQTLLVEYSSIIGQIHRAAELLQTGAVAEVSINTDRLVTIARLLTPDYFLLLALAPQGNYGKGRYALRIAAPKVRAELT